MRTIKDPETFEYIFERFYSNSRNPFTTAYHEFMIYKNSGYDVDDIYYTICDGILTRAVNENKNGSFTVF
jgi:hypothetical protein